MDSDHTLEAVFTKLRGIIGFIEGASEGDPVVITGPDWVVTVFVDEDNFYRHKSSTTP
jgi:hypothetical protein